MSLSTLSVPERFRDPFQPEPWARNAVRLAPHLRRDDALLRTFAESHMEGDPLADELVLWLEAEHANGARALFDRALREGIDSVQGAPTQLRAFFLEVERVPAWLDREQIELAAALYHRAYPGAERVLFSASLLAGYVSAGIAKTLVGTGALGRMAARRLAETQKFVVDVYGPELMSRASAGFATTVRVRVMHAMVRRQLLRAGFDVARWGVPINQADMAATALQFSITYVIGLRALGFHVTARESAAVLHFWRYVGSLMGVRADLLPGGEAEARAQLRLTVASQQGPDADCRALAAALLGVPLTVKQSALATRLATIDMRFRAGFARLALGREAADGLGLPRDSWRFVPLFSFFVVFGLECLRRCTPFATRWLTRLGRRHVEAQTRARLGGVAPTYQPHSHA